MPAALKNIRTLNRRSGMDVKLKIAPPTLKTISTAALEAGSIKTLLKKKQTRSIRFHTLTKKYRCWLKRFLPRFSYRLQILVCLSEDIYEYTNYIKIISFVCAMQ